jgi:hypothetical protein
LKRNGSLGVIWEKPRWDFFFEGDIEEDEGGGEGGRERSRMMLVEMSSDDC